MHLHLKHIKTTQVEIREDVSLTATWVEKTHVCVKTSFHVNAKCGVSAGKGNIVIIEACHLE